MNDVITRLAVIIPFFQREPGLLIEAVGSILNQSGRTCFDIIVIDDASPVSARNELSELAESGPRHTLTIIVQPNGGPGAARNTGLTYADSIAADYVAFLDSDDLWLPDHTTNGILALSSGADFYFCNHFRNSDAGGNGEDWFTENCPNITTLATPVQGPGNKWAFTSEIAVNVMAETYLSQTSTVMFNRNSLRNCFFDPNLKEAGEDHFLWIQMASLSSEIVFSKDVTVTCGRGINIYYSRQSWDKPHSEIPVGYNGLLSGIISSSFNLTDDVSKRIKNRKKLLYTLYSYLFFRNIIKFRSLNSRLLLSILKKSPLDFWKMPIRFLRMLMMSSKDRELYAQGRNA